MCVLRAHFNTVKCSKTIFRWGVAPTNTHGGVLSDPPLECVLYKMPQVRPGAYTTLITKMSTPHYTIPFLQTQSNMYDMLIDE